MTTTDYLLNGVLVLLVVLQMRGRRLNLHNVLLPLGIVGYVAVEYLHGIPTAGNDLLLAFVGAFAGVVLGTSCGLFTRVFRGAGGVVVAKAGVVAAVLWVLGVGCRLAFELYTSHGGEAAVGRFSQQHDVTSAAAWVACLVLMALGEVVSRTAVLAVRAWRLRESDAETVPAGGGAIMAR